MKYRYIVIILFASVAATVWLLWNYRINNPGIINVLGGSGSYKSDGIEISLPIIEQSIKSGYYMDGGTLMIQCIDAKGAIIKMCIDHRLGKQEYWGDVYFGVIHPRNSYGINLGKSMPWTKFVYSVAILDKNLGMTGRQSVDHWYPTLGMIASGYLNGIMKWYKSLF